MGIHAEARMQIAARAVAVAETVEEGAQRFDRPARRRQIAPEKMLHPRLVGITVPHDEATATDARMAVAEAREGAVEGLELRRVDVHGEESVAAVATTQI